MTVLNPAPRDIASTGRRSGGNKVDLRYLEDARDALTSVMAITQAVSDRSADHILARDALTVQTRQLAAISACLRAWDQLETPGTRHVASEPLPAPHGPTPDRVYADQLTAHAHASIAAARAEMVAGASPGARAIAQDAIRAQYRQLAALDLLSAPPAGKR
jgi:uncharacterized protein (DUF305 family)